MTEIAKLRRDIKLGKECVAHWVRMRDDLGGKEEPGPRSCAYCKLYWDNSGKDVRCPGCPIAVATGKGGCDDTPYSDAQDAWDDGGKDAWHAAAMDEIDFLEEVLRALQAKLRRRVKAPAAPAGEKGKE